MEGDYVLVLLLLHGLRTGDGRGHGLEAGGGGGVVVSVVATIIVRTMIYKEYIVIRYISIFI